MENSPQSPFDLTKYIKKLLHGEAAVSRQSEMVKLKDFDSAIWGHLSALLHSDWRATETYFIFLRLSFLSWKNVEHIRQGK